MDKIVRDRTDSIARRMGAVFIPRDEYAERVADSLGPDERACLLRTEWDEAAWKSLAMKALDRKGLLCRCRVTHEGVTRLSAIITTSGLAVRDHLRTKEPSR